MEFPIGAPASQLASAVECYARVGVRVLPLAGFPGTIPTAAQARNLASWASTYGPGGTFWAGKAYPASVAVSDIEFGNETSYTYQYSDNSNAGYAARAQAYALSFKEAEIAVKAVNPSVGLLAQADEGGTGSPAWVNNMFVAVPDLASRVAGWTVHPYGPTWQKKMDNLVNFTAANGAPSSIPIYVTELGISVDNGHCVYENYGWNACMTDSEAASALAGRVRRDAQPLRRTGSRPCTSTRPRTSSLKVPPTTARATSGCCSPTARRRAPTPPRWSRFWAAGGSAPPPPRAGQYEHGPRGAAATTWLCPPGAARPPRGASR